MVIKYSKSFKTIDRYNSSVLFIPLICKKINIFKKLRNMMQYKHVSIIVPINIYKIYKLNVKNISGIQLCKRLNNINNNI